MTQASRKRFKRTSRLTPVLLLVGILSIVAIRGQLLPMTTAWADRSMAQPRMILLAAGDIARCQSVGRAAKTNEETRRNLLSSREFSSPSLKANPAALRTADLVEQYPDARVLALGDLAYPDGTPADFALCYDRVWGSFKQRTYPTPGNHEYHSTDAYGYYDYWGSRAGPERRGYYAMHLNDWLLLSLNSEVAADTHSAQGRWLEDQLTQSDAACVLAFFHKPAFSTKTRDNSEEARRLFEILYRHGATLVLNGHNHFYERTRPLDAAGHIDPEHGIRAFVVGTGGTQPDDPRPPAAFSKRLIGGVNGLLKLDLSPGEYHWQFLSASRHEVLDNGTASCNSRRPAFISNP